MRKWAIAKGRSNARALLKQKLCKAIVDWKVDHNIAVANGTVETFQPITKCPLRFNTKQFLNVIFGPVMQTKLLNGAQSL